MTNKITKFIKLCSFTLLTGLAAPALASEYNEGFIAAESGNYQTAVSKWGPLASAGHAAAQFNIALMYHGGLGVSPNEAEAVKWYKKSANNGFFAAQEFLSAAYEEGWFGLPQDKNLARFWEEKASLENY